MSDVMPIPGKEVYMPPVHWYQQGETFDTGNFHEPDVQSYTYQDEWHAVYTIQLGELIESGVFDWARPEVDWSDAAYDQEQYERLCSYFNERFYWREISALPIKEWFMHLHRKLVYELMPKYRPMYAALEQGFNPLADSDKYFKERHINSQYPETLLSENADYISDGHDVENEELIIKNVGDTVQNFKDKYRSVDELVLDELESLFVCMYTSHVNGW